MQEPAMAQLAQAAYFDEPRKAARRYHDSAEFAEVRRLVGPQRGRALDLGAGNGILSWALAEEGWNVTAVEPDSSDLVGAGAIRVVSGESKSPIDVVEAFGEAIPLEAANYDLVVARQFLHHANDLGAFCREMARLVRSGGTVITLRDHVISGPDQLQQFLNSHPLHHLYGGENAFTLAQYRDAITGAGLEIVNELNSFQSVVNYDPMSEGQVRDRLSDLMRGFRKPVRAVLEVIPFRLIAAAAAAADRRPGRLVSFVCRKAD
jgi:SAM-dependent methyltransferase